MKNKYKKISDLCISNRLLIDASKYQIFEWQLEEYISFREALKRIRNETKEWCDYGKDVFMISTSNR